MAARTSVSYPRFPTLNETTGVRCRKPKLSQVKLVQAKAKLSQVKLSYFCSFHQSLMHSFKMAPVRIWPGKPFTPAFLVLLAVVESAIEDFRLRDSWVLGRFMAYAILSISKTLAAVGC